MTTILWVDDEVLTDDPFVGLLVQEGYSVHLACSGTEAFQRVHNSGCDVLLLDLHLPDMGGVHLLDRLRRNGIQSPTIVLTGFATIEAAAACMRLGAVNLIEKPVDIEGLKQALQLALSAHAVTGRQRLAVPRLAEISSTLDGLSAQEESMCNSNLRLRLFKLLVEALTDPSVPYRAVPTLMSALRIVVAGENAVAVSGLLTRLEEQDGRPPHRQDPVVEKILSALAVRPRITSERHLASFVGLSPGRLGAMMRSATGRSFREWRIILRTLRVLHVLSTTEEQIAQIAFECGYEHPSQLDRDFCRVFGIPPRKFRGILDQANVPRF